MTCMFSNIFLIASVQNWLFFIPLRILIPPTVSSSILQGSIVRRIALLVPEDTYAWGRNPARESSFCTIRSLTSWRHFRNAPNPLSKLEYHRKLCRRFLCSVESYLYPYISDTPTRVRWRSHIQLIDSPLHGFNCRLSTQRAHPIAKNDGDEFLKVQNPWHWSDSYEKNWRRGSKRRETAHRNCAQTPHAALISATGT